MTYLLVPGAGGSAWYWHRLVPLLEARDHVAIAVDLPARDESAGLAAYAEAIVAAGSGQDGITLVAQSMAGFSAPMACARLDVRRLALVNAMVPRPGETPGDWWSNTRQSQARADRAAADGRQLTEEFDVKDEFFHDVPEDLVAEALRRPEDAEQADRPFADPWPLDLDVLSGGHLIALSQPESLATYLTRG